jgi:hypothetical protein
MIDDSEFLRLFNAVAKVAKTPANPPVPAESLDQNFQELNIDSLDGLIMGMYLCEIFQVPEEIGKNFQPQTVGEFMAMLIEHAEKVDIDVDEAIKSLK